MTDVGIEKANDELHRISEDEVMRERKEEGKKETVLSMHTEGFPVETIARVMKMPEEKVLSTISHTQ
ncbi:hypothetical protein FQ087_17145 [Sporosarcina sp. ANT_H38]|uniref:hypothetical protein n=1 Tax=Sporosarcina sp. ANT_H38 TaxID=2597358 RepID=UPI0011F3658E|nr:hypothetical protein [Sporosarcina sp. ANT_H38]KAA0948716.1 hypothetical protein FQ087_17145 [Sporosarcina sp. ANT_H38]